MKKLEYAIIGAALASFALTGHAFASEAKTAEASLGGGFAITIAASPLELSEAATPKAKSIAKTDPLITGSTGNSGPAFDGGFAITIMGSGAN